MSKENNEEEQQQQGESLHHDEAPFAHELSGFLAPVLDPVGKGLGTVLRPVGIGVETITKPIVSGVGGITRPALGPVTGEKHEKAEVLGGDNKDSYEHGKDSLGGRLQTADNPLGLDQTGKFGFREE